MFTELGVIEKIKGDKALVRLERSSACESCSSKGACGMDGGRQVEIEVFNSLGAELGERVEISMAQGSLLKASALVYLVPVLCLLFGAVLGENLSLLLGLGTGASTGAGALAGLGLGLGFLVFIDRRVRSRPDYHPRMNRIIERKASAGACNR